MSEGRSGETKITYATSTGMPFVLGDHAQITVVNDEVALVFHQLDYLSVNKDAATAEAGSPTLVASTTVVAKVVMRLEAFRRLVVVGGTVLESADRGSK